MKFIRDLREGERVVSYAAVRSKQVKFKRNNEPYLNLLLVDRTGQIEAKIWDDVEVWRERLQEGDLVKYKGTVQLYNGSRQLIIDRIRQTVPEDADNGFDARDLIPTTEYDIAEMWQRLLQLVEEHTVRPSVLQLLKNILSKYAEPIRSYPAGIEIHHNYWGGFLEHVVSVLETAVFLASKYPGLDKDLLVAGAVLHDIGKLEELCNPQSPAYTTRGVLIGHVVMGRDLLLAEAEHVADLPPNFLLLLEHLILSHQGQLEWGSPKRPKTPEALILHYIDDLDARLNRVFRLLKEDQGDSQFTQYDRLLGRAIFKGDHDVPSASAETG